MIIDPLCPHCKTELEYDDTYDMEYNEDSITLYQVGHCPKCKKSYQWYTSAYCIEWENSGLREC